MTVPAMADSNSANSRNLVLRTIYIDPMLDDWLKQQAFSSNTSKNDLFRQYIEKGIVAEAEQDSKSPRKYADVLSIFQDSVSKQVLNTLLAKIGGSAAGAKAKKSTSVAEAAGDKPARYAGTAASARTRSGAAKKAAAKKLPAKKAVKKTVKKAVAARRPAARKTA